MSEDIPWAPGNFRILCEKWKLTWSEDLEAKWRLACEEDGVTDPMPDAATDPYEVDTP